MKKSIIVILFFACTALFADDFRWDLINALTKNDYQTAENLINRNINSLSAQDRRQVVNFAITYSHGDTTLRVLNLMRTHGTIPGAFDLYTAINRNQSDSVVQYILDCGAAANGEILLVAMERQRFGFVRQFIQAGVDVNYQYPLTRSYSDGMTALLYASRFNNLELVNLLLDRGANINARNRDGSTALSIAQSNGNAQISSLLIERGANQTGTAPNNAASGQQTGGITSLMDAPVIEFQPGTYRLSSGSRDLRFSGNASYGNINFVINNRVSNGTYQIANGNIVIIVEGRTFTYKVDSPLSFSGNGETWIRTGN